MLVGAVVILTTVTQAFEFGSIRILEGYWGFGRTRQWLADRFAHRFVVRQAEARKVRSDLVYAAFDTSRADFARAVSDMTIVNFVEADILDCDAKPVLTTEKERELDEVDWRVYASAGALRRLGEHERLVRLLPDRHRVMPTRLGNTLRSCEDRANQEIDGSVQGMIHRTYQRLPLHLRVEIDQFRNRLGLYASLVATMWILMILSAVVVMPVNLLTGSLLVAAGFILVGTFYRATVSSAEAYGVLLEEVAALSSRGELSGRRSG